MKTNKVAECQARRTPRTQSGQGSWQFEPLEERRLLSVSIDAGILRITGTDTDDFLYLHQARSGMVTLLLNGTEQSFSWKLFNKIEIRTGAGRDSMQIGSVRRSLSASVRIWAGDDTDNIAINASKGRVVGGSGDDGIYCGGERDLVLGGDGNDLIDGGGGEDTLLGGAGNDTLGCDGGNGWIQGDEGDDRLYGGSGNDTVLGGDGNDLLMGGRGLNRVLGGAGVDSFYYLSVNSHYEILDHHPGEVLEPRTPVGPY